MEVDVVVVGGGVIGASIARELSRFNLRGVLVEKEIDVAMGTSKANSAIIHAGYDPEPETLKAKLNVLGNRMYDRIAEELDVPFRRNGSLVLAFNEDDLKILNILFKRGKENNVPDLQIIDGDELQSVELSLNPNAIAALYAPTAGIVNPFEMTIANAENALENGFKVLLETHVTGFEKRKNRVEAVRTNKGLIKANFVVNAAGLYSHELALMLGDCDFTITPRKGEYMVLDKNVGNLVDHTIFPTPTPTSKGIAVSPTTDGNILIGPTAEDIEDKTDSSTTSESLKKVLEESRKLVPSISLHDVITSFTGLRAVPNTDDFIISPHEDVSGFINAAGIHSPGISSAPAIALIVVQILEKEGLRLVQKEDFNPHRRGMSRFSELSNEMKHSMILAHPYYGRVVCRCETVTEGEVLEAIHRPLGAKTVDSIKIRTRAGMGRCQGGFCGPRVVSLLAKELGSSLDEVTVKGSGSKDLAGNNRRVDEDKS